MDPPEPATPAADDRPEPTTSERLERGFASRIETFATGRHAAGRDAGRGGRLERRRAARGARRARGGFTVIAGSRLGDARWSRMANWLEGTRDDPGE